MKTTCKTIPIKKVGAVRSQPTEDEKNIQRTAKYKLPARLSIKNLKFFIVQALLFVNRENFGYWQAVEILLRRVY